MRVIFICLLFSTLCMKAVSPTEFFGRPAQTKYKNLRFQFQLDFRNSFIGKNTAPVDVYGVNIGLKHKEKFRYGIGFYFIDQTTKRQLGFSDDGKQIKLKDGEYISTPSYLGNRNLFLYYGTVNFTYTLINNKYINLDIPIEVGFGRYAYQLENAKVNPDLPIADQNAAADKLNQIKNSNKKVGSGTFVPLLGGLALTLKLHRWVYPQVSGGYRKSILESDFKADFDGFYYHIALQIHFGEIYLDLFKKKPPIDL